MSQSGVRENGHTLVANITNHKDSNKSVEMCKNGNAYDASKAKSVSTPTSTLVYSEKEPMALSFLHNPRYAELDKDLLSLSLQRERETHKNTDKNKDNAIGTLKHAVSEIFPVQNPPHSAGATSSHSRSKSINDELSEMPPLIRKKSGEVVKSSLKLSSLGRGAQSLPSTPTYKSVRFNNQSFVDVKYFHEKDVPTAISVENSPVAKHKKPHKKHLHKYNWLVGDSDDSDSEDSSDSEYASNFGNSDTESDTNDDEELLQEWDWTLQMCNFGSVNYSEVYHTMPPVFLEGLFLSTDRKFLKGHIAAQNYAYEKRVSIKYSLNNWKIVSEIQANYVGDIPRQLRKHNYDRFVFKIPLIALIEDKMVKDTVRMVACIKYETRGEEYWDNNGQKNYEILLKSKKLKRVQQKRKEKELKRLFQNGITVNTRKNGIDMDEVSKLLFNVNSAKQDTVSVSKNDSYFPPFESFSPSSIDFKESMKTSNFNDFGESMYNSAGMGVGFTSLYSRGASASTVENLAFENENVSQKTPLEDNFSNLNKANSSRDSKFVDEIHKVRQERPSVDSSMYKKLVENYCFFQG